MQNKTYELTEGILKSVDSWYHAFQSKDVGYILKYKGNAIVEGCRLYKNEGQAKRKITEIIEGIFRHGNYWNEDICKRNVKRDTGYDVDYSGTISIFSGIGLTSRYEEPEIKKCLRILG